MRAHPGIGRYIRELVGHFPAEPDFSLSFLAGHSPIYSIQEQWETLRLARRANLLHVPHFNYPLLWNRALIVTIHDLIYISYPAAAKNRAASLYLKFFLNALQYKNAQIITVSEFTKAELLRLFPKFKAENVTVTYEAVSGFFKVLPDDVRNSFRPFVLFVGSLKPHKNLSVLIRSMAELREQKNIPHELLLVGSAEGVSTEVRELIKKHASFVRCLGKAPDDELRRLYNRASAFVLPSFFEGFGLPVLEAMACGCPVIAANTASLPEVGGSAACFFDPRRVDALSDVLYNVLTDENKRNSMKKNGLEQIQRFSWSKTALQTLEVYRRVRP